VNIIDHGYYDKKTGLMEINPILNQSSNFKSNDIAIARAARTTTEAAFQQ
jgi:hypothetical protein